MDNMERLYILLAPSSNAFSRIIPYCVDRRHTLFHRIRGAGSLLRSIPGRHICRTSLDYSFLESDDEKIAIQFVVDESVLRSYSSFVRRFCQV